MASVVPENILTDIDNNFRVLLWTWLQFFRITIEGLEEILKGMLTSENHMTITSSYAFRARI